MTVRLISDQQQTPDKNTKQRRFSAQQKYQIIQEAETIKNYQHISTKYDISRVSLYSWRKQILADPESFLNKIETKRATKQHNKLVAEIEELKEVIVEQSKEISLLKKGMR